MDRPRPPAELASLWRIEGHLKNISHCAILIVLMLLAWLLVAGAGFAMRLAGDVSRPTQPPRAASTP